MCDKIKISIIVPIYNVEKYLKECLDSLINQTYKNLEIILINDGSTDDSHNICQKYSKIDKRIKYIKKENSGVSDTRNHGIKTASGELLMFVDSDDYLDINLIETLIKNYKQNEMLCFGYKMIYLNKEENIISSEQNQYKEKDSIVLDNAVKGFLWNKLFETKIIKDNNLIFNKKISYCEDLLFVKEYIKYCKKIKYIAGINYNYRIRKNSVTGNFCTKKNISALNSYEEVIKEFNKNNVAKNELIYEYLFVYYRLRKIIKNDKTIKIRKEFLKNEKQIIKNKPLKEKIKFYIVKYIPSIYEQMRTLKKKNMFD